MMLLPMPMKLPAAMVTEPAQRAPGATCTPSPMTQSWSTEAPVLMMHAPPMTARVPTMAPAAMIVPEAICAVGLIHAVGWMSTGRSMPRSRADCRRVMRSWFRPTASRMPLTSPGRLRRSSIGPSTGRPRTRLPCRSRLSSRKPTTSNPPIACAHSATTAPWPPAPSTTTFISMSGTRALSGAFDRFWCSWFSACEYRPQRGNGNPSGRHP